MGVVTRKCLIVELEQKVARDTFGFGNNMKNM